MPENVLSQIPEPTAWVNKAKERYDQLDLETLGSRLTDELMPKNLPWQEPQSFRQLTSDTPVRNIYPRWTLIYKRVLALDSES